MKSKILPAGMAGLVLASNALALAPDMGAGRNPRGQILAANEARFTSANYSEPLTAYTVGWRDPENLDQLLEELIPSVEVGRRFEFKKGVNKEYFLSETDDTRAIGSSFKKVEYTGETVNEKTINKGLTICVDHDEQLVGNWQEKYVGLLMQRLLRNDFRRGIALIDAAANSTSKTWNTSANPDSDMRTMLSTGADKSGMYANVIAMGEGAWHLRAAAYEGNTAPASGVAAGLTPAELAAKLMVDKVQVVKARYASTTTARSKIVNNTVYSYMAQPGVGKDDPSAVKRFITPTEAGRFRVYVEQHDKYTEITVEHYSNIVVCSSLGIEKLAIS